MRIRAAMAFAVGTFLGGFVHAVRYAGQHDGAWGELGRGAALIGMIAFAGVFGVMIFGYGTLSRQFHRDDRKTAASGLAVLLGVPFWLVILPFHEYLRDGLGLSDHLWLAEALVFCGLSFEILRATEKALLRRQA